MDKKNSRCQAIVLATNDNEISDFAGPRGLEPIAGRAMIRYTLDVLASARSLGIEISDAVLLVSMGEADAYRAELGSEIRIVEQNDGATEADSLRKALAQLSKNGDVFVLRENSPLIPGVIADILLSVKEEKNGAAAFFDVTTDRLDEGELTSNSVSAHDLRESFASMHAIASCVTTDILCETLTANKNLRTVEDCLIAMAEGNEVIEVNGIALPAAEVNNFFSLSLAELIIREQINTRHLLAGVRLIDPAHTYIDYDVQIGRGSVIYPGNVLMGDTILGERVTLLPANMIEDSVVGSEVRIGPSTHLRPKTVLGNGCKVGDFVELKNVHIGEGTKIPHLTYLGDGRVGAHCNIGCGVIFSNYDGIHKFETIVGDNAFVGGNATLIAPVEVGDGAYIAAGSTITDAVPAGALGIARQRQSNKERWAAEKSPIVRGKEKQTPTQK